MRKRMRAAVAIAGAVTALAAGMGTANAAPADVRCGGYVNWMGEVVYEHCGPTNVVIYVDRWNIGGIRDYEKCVSPGLTKLGPWPDWQGAHYLRPC